MERNDQKDFSGMWWSKRMQKKDSDWVFFIRRSEAECRPIRAWRMIWNQYRKQSVRSILFPIFIVSHNVTYTTYKTTIFTKQSGSNHRTLPSFSCPLSLLKTPYDVFKCVLRHSSFLVIFPCHSCSWSQTELNKQDQLPYSITENIALK